MKDFIDIGSSKGGSVKYASAKFGNDGYGIDIDAKKCQEAQALNIDVRPISIFDVHSKARWVTCMHVLEHLSSREEITEMIIKMVEIAQEGVYITIPYFDSDGYLFDRRLRFFWSHWKGHTYHLSRLELHNILEELNLSFRILKWGKVDSSLDSSIVPITAPVDVLGYDSKTMKTKNNIPLLDVYKEVRCTITIQDHEHPLTGHKVNHVL